MWFSFRYCIVFEFFSVWTSFEIAHKLKSSDSDVTDRECSALDRQRHKSIQSNPIRIHTYIIDRHRAPIHQHVSDVRYECVATAEMEKIELFYYFVFISFSIEKQCCDRLCLGAICYDDDNDDDDIHLVLAVASTVVCVSISSSSSFVFFFISSLVIY